MNASEAIACGLLEVGDASDLHPSVIVAPEDLVGSVHHVSVGAGVRIGPGAILHGGLIVEDEVVIEERAVVGRPEWGTLDRGPLYTGGKGGQLFSDVGQLYEGRPRFMGVVILARARWLGTTLWYAQVSR